MLSFRQLEVVHAVCTHGSATLAADALGVSQPAVSTLLREATRDAGFPLFARKQGRLQPTMETELLLADLELIFESFERVNRLVNDMQDFNAGVIRVAATPVLADNILPAALARFHGRRPRVQITLQTMDNPGVVNAVSQNRVDFGLVLTPLGRPEARLIELCAAELIAVVHPDHPLASRHIVSPPDLIPYPLISFSRSMPLGHLVEESFRKANVQRRISLEVNQSSVASALARAGAGVAVIDPFLFTSERDYNVVRLAFRPRTPVKAQVLIPKNSTLTRPARFLLALLREAAGTASTQEIS